MPWTDSHCHLEADWVVPAREAGVIRMISIGTDAETTAAAVALAEGTDGVWATAGLHPHDAVQGVETVEGFLACEVVVAVGECGLDYHYDHSPRAVQRDAFAQQVGLAHRHGLALVVHTREAWDDTFDVLQAEGVPERTVFHCFTGGPEEARRCLDAGASLSFSGIVTFKKADDVRAAAALCPLDRVLVETDAPYLAPAPHRGATNTPALLPVVAAGVAAAKDVPVEDVERATWENAERLFGLAAPLAPS